MSRFQPTRDTCDEAGTTKAAGIGNVSISIVHAMCRHPNDRH